MKNKPFFSEKNTRSIIVKLLFQNGGQTLSDPFHYIGDKRIEHPPSK